MGDGASAGDAGDTRTEVVPLEAAEGDGWAADAPPAEGAAAAADAGANKAAAGGKEGHRPSLDTYSHLRKYDIDGDGRFDEAELRALLRGTVRTEERASRMRRYAVLAVAVTAGLLVCVFCMCIAAVVLTRTIEVSEAGTSTSTSTRAAYDMAVAGSGGDKIVATAATLSTSDVGADFDFRDLYVATEVFVRGGDGTLYRNVVTGAVMDAAGRIVTLHTAHGTRIVADRSMLMLLDASNNTIAAQRYDGQPTSAGASPLGGEVSPSTRMLRQATDQDTNWDDARSTTVLRPATNYQLDTEAGANAAGPGACVDASTAAAEALELDEAVFGAPIGEVLKQLLDSTWNGTHGGAGPPDASDFHVLSGDELSLGITFADSRAVPVADLGEDFGPARLRDWSYADECATRSCGGLEQLVGAQPFAGVAYFTDGADVASCSVAVHLDLYAGHSAAQADSVAGSSDNREASIGLEIVYAPSPPPPRFQLINETNTTANVTPSAMTGIAAYIAAGGITSPSILLDEEIGATMFGCAGENLAPGSPDTPLSASLQLGAAGLNLPADSRCDAVVAQFLDYLCENAEERASCLGELNPYDMRALMPKISVEQSPLYGRPPTVLYHPVTTGDPLRDRVAAGLHAFIAGGDV